LVSTDISAGFREAIFKEVIGFLKKGCWSMKLFIHHLEGAKNPIPKCSFEFLCLKIPGTLGGSVFRNIVQTNSEAEWRDLEKKIRSEY